MKLWQVIENVNVKIFYILFLSTTYELLFFCLQTNRIIVTIHTNAYVEPGPINRVLILIRL